MSNVITSISYKDMTYMHTLCLLHENCHMLTERCPVQSTLVEQSANNLKDIVKGPASRLLDEVVVGCD